MIQHITLNDLRAMWQVLPEVWAALESYRFAEMLRNEGIDAFAALVDGLAAQYGRRDD